MISVLVFCLPFIALGQGRIAEIWTQPAVFQADEEVSFYFDLTGTELAAVAEEQGVCVWTWFPSDPGETWGSPSDAAKLTHVEGNVWRWDLIPTEFYGVAAGKNYEFYGQLQTHNGEKQSLFAPDQDPANHITMYGLTTIKNDAVILDYHPKQFTPNKPVSVLLNAANVYPDNCDTDPILGELANAPNVHVHAGINGWNTVIENNEANQSKTQLTHLGDDIYRWDFIPNEYFGVKDGELVSSIHAVFASNDWSFIGKNTDCSDFFIEVPEQTEPVVPVLTLFPSKVSVKDLMCIIRTDNESYVSALEYTITAGTKTLKGEFEGKQAEQIAYINLADELKDMGELEKIHLQIKDNTGRIIADNDIVIVQLSN